MSPPVAPIQGSPSLPNATSVVIIGGGIVGVCTALYLAEKGIPVVLCEKGEIGAEQSSRNWGWTRVMGRDVREIPLGLESLRLWRGLNQSIGAETGFRQCGIVYLCDNQQEMAEYEAWLAQARSSSHRSSAHVTSAGNRPPLASPTSRAACSRTSTRRSDSVPNRTAMPAGPGQVRA